MYKPRPQAPTLFLIINHLHALTHIDEHTDLGLKGAVERGQEVRSPHKAQHSSLHHGALRILILKQHVFLQHLHRKQALAAPLLCQQDLRDDKETLR